MREGTGNQIRIREIPIRQPASNQSGQKPQQARNWSTTAADQLLGTHILALSAPVPSSMDPIPDWQGAWLAAAPLHTQKYTATFWGCCRFFVLAVLRRARVKDEPSEPSRSPNAIKEDP